MSAVTRPAEAAFTEQRSKFYALLFPLREEAALEAILKAQRKQHRKAVHHCWAVRLKGADGRLLEKSKDDGEVGHPGRVLLELLRKHDLEGGLAVSRIFGGIKLGVGGVTRAFREAGAQAVEEYLRPNAR